MYACVCDSEPDSLELQEAISKGTFQHDVTNLEPATTYSLYLKAYSPLGASQQSHTVVATTLGGGNMFNLKLSKRLENRLENFFKTDKLIRL